MKTEVQLLDSVESRIEFAGELSRRVPTWGPAAVRSASLGELQLWCILKADAVVLCEVGALIVERLGPDTAATHPVVWSRESTRLRSQFDDAVAAVHALGYRRVELRLRSGPGVWKRRLLQVSGLRYERTLRGAGESEPGSSEPLDVEIWSSQQEA